MNFSIKSFNIADWFSLFRIFFSPLLLIFVFLNERMIFGILLALSFSTDAIDGFLARRLKIVSERGALLDTVGDMAAIFTALVGLIWFEWHFLLEQKLPIAIILLLYLFSIISASWRYGRFASFHTYLAKISFILVSIFVLSIFFFGVSYPLFYLTFAVVLLEQIEEIALIFILPKQQSDVKGLWWVLRKNNVIK